MDNEVASRNIIASAPHPKLAPCPFCGCAAGVWKLAARDKYHVVCNHCEAESSCADSEDEAAILWNTRTETEMDEHVKPLAKTSEEKFEQLDERLKKVEKVTELLIQHCPEIDFVELIRKEKRNRG